MRARIIQDRFGNPSFRNGKWKVENGKLLQFSFLLLLLLFDWLDLQTSSEDDGIGKVLGYWFRIFFRKVGRVEHFHSTRQIT